jgi:hypothetical protein
MRKRMCVSVDSSSSRPPSLRFSYSSAAGKDTTALSSASASSSTPQPQGTSGNASEDQRLATFRATLLAVEKGNMSVQKLNTYKKLRRDDPSNTDLVSDDEEELPAPDLNAFITLFSTETPTDTSSTAPNIHNPTDPDLNPTNSNSLPTTSRSNSTPVGTRNVPIVDKVNWHDVMTRSLAGDPAALGSLLNPKQSAVDYQAFGPVYTFQDVSQNNTC